MSGTLIKICGLSDAATVSAAIAAGADMIGFIFFEKSPRHVTLATASALSRHAGHAVKKVAVTVNATDDFLEAMIAQVSPDLLQLHGSELPARVLKVKERFLLPVMKAIAIRERADLDAAKAYEDVADRLLFDAKPPSGSQLPGGNAVSFDWTLLKNREFRTPWMLSGGLEASNVMAAIRTTGATAIDVSSGVEDAPGVKSIEKIQAFVKTVRDHDGQAKDR